MKFSDIFLPKIARSDPNVRKDAIAAESNVELLKKVSQKDSDPGVRDFALKRIKELETA